MIPKDEETNETTQSYNSVEGMLQTRMCKPIQEVTIGNQMTLKIKDCLLTSTLKELVFANNYTCKLNIVVCNVKDSLTRIGL